MAAKLETKATKTIEFFNQYFYSTQKKSPDGDRAFEKFLRKLN